MCVTSSDISPIELEQIYESYMLKQWEKYLWTLIRKSLLSELQPSFPFRNFWGFCFFPYELGVEAEVEFYFRSTMRLHGISLNNLM